MKNHQLARIFHGISVPIAASSSWALCLRRLKSFFHCNNLHEIASFKNDFNRLTSLRISDLTTKSHEICGLEFFFHKKMRFVFSAFVFLVLILLIGLFYQNCNSLIATNPDPPAPIPTAEPSSCPTNFINVPKLPPYTSKDFCVSKFEMKIKDQSDGQAAKDKVIGNYSAETRASGTPWVYLNREDALSRCQALGAGYDLISNDEWQSIAINIEGLPVNWTSGQLGLEMMYIGHSDSLPNAALQVTSTDDFYDGTGNTELNPWSEGKDQRRIFFLSNNEIIWDFSGNVWEWVKDSNATSYGANTYISQVTSSSHPATDPNGRNAKTQFGPSGSYVSLVEPQFGGLGHGTLLEKGGAILRGGYWYYSFGSGAFDVNLTNPGSVKGAIIGFRCVKH